MRYDRYQRGFTTLMVLFLVLLLSGLAFGLVQEGLAARTSVGHHESSHQALETAELGLIRGETEIRAQEDLDGNGEMGSTAGSVIGGEYEVWVRDDPVSVDRWILTATGRFGPSQRRIEVGVRRWQNAEYVEALFAMEDLTLSNVSTDAYDSRLGTYASQLVNSDANGTYAELGGSVGSNMNIYLDGTADWVRGNAIPGPEGETILSGDPTVMGDIAPRTVLWEKEPATYDAFRDAMLNNDNAAITSTGPGNTVRYNSRNMSLDIVGGTHAVLPGGTYFFTDVFIRGSSTLEFTGPTTIYITGTLEIQADADLLAGSPADLRIFAHPYPLGRPNITETEIKVAGGSNITWALYAPGADLNLGGGNHFYGAAVAKNIELNGTNYFHYDKALGEVGYIGAARMERLYWRDLTPPRR